MDSAACRTRRSGVPQSWLALWMLAALVPLAASADEHVDLAAIHRIKSEAFAGSKVMEDLFWLTDANGPRLTGSPGLRAAQDWALRTLQGWGAANPHLEKWGTFGRGWSMSRFALSMVAPVYAPLQGVPKAWSGGTDGAVTAELVLAPLFLPSERGEMADPNKVRARIKKFVEEQKGKLRGKVVLLDKARDLELPTELESTRYDDAKLAALAQAPEPASVPPLEWPITKFPSDPKKMREFLSELPLAAVEDYFQRRSQAYNALWTFLRAEGAVAAFMTDRRGDGGLVFVESVNGWDPKVTTPPPVIVLAPEPYDRLVRLVEKKVPVKVELDLQVRTYDDHPDGFNVVAEIPGSKKADEVVMMGAHLDSWHAGTGATDNAAGSAVVLEAFRILKALKLPMDRTVRLALWSGEEQGLLGSVGYVKAHFADPVTMALKPEHAKLAAYFNLDNGTGKIRGVYLQGNDMVRPIFEQWLAPFHDLGASTLTIRNTGGTDHEPFDGVGLPGFQFIQDPLDYTSRTHHSNLDTYDHLQAGDLMQASAILAAFVYQAATRPERLPRKPLPSPMPPKRAAADDTP
ncbi:MAG: M28 family peptidase [Myxococcaceae bacterium]